MKFYSLKNLSSQDVVEMDPRVPAKRPDFETKEKFREWCNDIKTEHCFYSHVEALSPTTRVTVNNTPLYMHGFTADYDSDVTREEALSLVTRNAPSGLLPKYISTTFSGGLRLTWEFSDPVLVDTPELSEKFMKLLVSELGCRNLIAGFDAASEKLGQYWEAGEDWAEFPNSKPISVALLELLFFRAANQAKIKADGPVIPIEKVAEQVEKMYPGRVKDFTEGARVPLFWVEPFQDRAGAQIGALGMLCYSTRAGKSFVPWAEILGAEFMRDYQAQRVGAAAEHLYYDGKHYWRRGAGQQWHPANKEDTIMWLKGQGISQKPSAKKIASEAEEVLLHCQEHHRVHAAAPIVHDSRLLVNINGEKFLNISTKRLIEPAEEDGDFPWLRDFFDKIWDDPVEDQRDNFLAWLRYAYMSCLDGRPAQGQAVIIAGPPSSGKTFLNHRILGEIFGGFSDATEFLMGRTNFNKDNSEVYLWAIDDTKGAASWENHNAFSAAIKKHVANPQVRCEGKGKNAFTIPWKGRIVITCNLDKESLNIVPHLNLTIKDKLSLFTWNGWKAPFEQGGKSETVVLKELPFFLRWLLNWNPPAAVLSDNPRYVINSYHHPKMLKEAYQGSPAARLREEIQLFIEEGYDKKQGKLWVTAAGLRKLLSENSSSSDVLREFGRNRMPAALQELDYPTRQSGNMTQYLLFDPDMKGDSQII